MHRGAIRPWSAGYRLALGVAVLFAAAVLLLASHDAAEAAACPDISAHSELVAADAPTGDCSATWTTATGEISILVQILSNAGQGPCPSRPCVRVIANTPPDNDNSKSFVPQLVDVPTSGTCTSVTFKTTAPVSGPSGTHGSMGVTIGDGDKCRLTATAIANGLKVTITGTITRSNLTMTFTGGSSRVGTVSGDSAVAFAEDRIRLLADGPDRSFHDRFGGAPNGGPATTPFSFNLAADLSSGTFAARFSQFETAFGAGAADLPDTLAALVSHGQGTQATRGVATDIWVEGRFGTYADDSASGDRDGQFAIAFFGIDHLVGDDLLVGLMASVDYMEESSTALSSDIDGLGWMAGPYMSARLGAHLFLDLSGAWGQSDNDITVSADPGSFETDRWLVKGSLTGSFAHGAWRLSPAVGAIYVEERQKAYTTAGGIDVPARTAMLGRMTFGPTVAYRHATSDGGSVEPHVSMIGQWDFSSTGDVTLGTVSDTLSDLSATVRTGVTIRWAAGTSLGVEGRYGGLFADAFESWSGRATLSAPID